MLKINPSVAAIEEETAFTVLDRANALKAKGHPVINLGIGQPDFTPPKLDQKLVDASGRRLTAWAYPQDPALPSLPAVSYPEAAGVVLAKFGIAAEGAKRIAVAAPIPLPPPDTTATRRRLEAALICRT